MGGSKQINKSTKSVFLQGEMGLTGIPGPSGLPGPKVIMHALNLILHTVLMSVAGMICIDI